MAPRPSKGTKTGRVWDIADALTKQAGRQALRSEVVRASAQEGLNSGTANTQFGHWNRKTQPKRLAGNPKFTGQPDSQASPSHKRQDARQDAREPENLNWSVLLKNGFTYLCDWQMTDMKMLALDRAAPDVSGLYAFVLDDEIVYIGTTRRALKQRMADYRRGHAGQKTSSRIKGLIVEALERKQQVRVLFATPKDATWRGLPVVIAEGLEVGLIEKLRPKWNKRGAS